MTQQNDGVSLVGVPSIEIDIPSVHQQIATVEVLLRDRRALYQLAAELVAGVSLGNDVLENPVVRNHVGQALAGGERFSLDELIGLGAIISNRIGKLPLAARPEASELLAPALRQISAGLPDWDNMTPGLRLLTRADDALVRTEHVIREGLALARAIDSELVDDLLPHVALLGVVDGESVGGLASASSHEYPGLVLLDVPTSPIEVAEALAHEAAHQKLFDLEITRDLLSTASHNCPGFSPPWLPADRVWPLDQALAAAHAYACLARFAGAASRQQREARVTTTSLLPVAADRFRTISAWLLNREEYLGCDARRLLRGLLGQAPRLEPESASESCHEETAFPAPDELFESRSMKMGERTLVGIRTQPPTLYWLS